MKNYYDVLKVFAILLVVIGHITILYGGGYYGLEENRLLTTVCTAIYLFHMPLFITLSGAIFQIGIERGKYAELIPFVHNKLLRIGVPFLTVGSLFLAPTLFLLDKEPGSLLDIIQGVICCSGIERHLWYLPALLWIFFITWTCIQIHINRYLLFIISVLLAVLYSLFVHYNFMHISNAIHYLPYFVFGMILQAQTRYVNKRTATTSTILFAIMGTIIKLTSIAWLDNVLSILLPCTIIAIFLPIAKWALPFVCDNKLLKQLLNQSFAIYLFHVIIIYTLYSWIGNSLPTIIMVPFVFVISIVGSMGLAQILRFLHLQIIIGEK